MVTHTFFRRIFPSLILKEVRSVFFYCCEVNIRRRKYYLYDFLIVRCTTLTRISSIIRGSFRFPSLLQTVVLALDTVHQSLQELLPTLTLKEVRSDSYTHDF